MAVIAATEFEEVFVANSVVAAERVPAEDLYSDKGTIAYNYILYNEGLTKQRK